MRLALALVVVLIGVVFVLGCGAEAPTTEVQQVADKICACEDSACAEGIIAEIKQIQSRYSRFEDAAKAQAILTEATICALKIDPELARRMNEELR